MFFHLPPIMLVTATDGEILKTLGDRLRTIRLQRNLTRDEVALRAGLNRNTIANAEAGADPRLSTVIKILRVLQRLEALDAFLPAPTVSPMQIVETKGKPRQRARKTRHG